MERNQTRKTDVINIASIRVAGGAGLGMVAMALVLALAIPRIGQTLAFGAVLGLALAAGLILWRRRKGPMPTSGGRIGANTTLSIDQPVTPENADDTDYRFSDLRFATSTQSVASASAPSVDANSR